MEGVTAALSGGILWSAIEEEGKVGVLEPRKSWNKSLSSSFCRRRESTPVFRSPLLWFFIIIKLSLSVSVATSPPHPPLQSLSGIIIISWTHSTRERDQSVCFMFLSLSLGKCKIKDEKGCLFCSSSCYFIGFLLHDLIPFNIIITRFFK